MLHGTTNAKALDLHPGQYFVADSDSTAMALSYARGDRARLGDARIEPTILVVATSVHGASHPVFGGLENEEVESCYDYDSEADIVIGLDDATWGQADEPTVVLQSEAAIAAARSLPRYAVGATAIALLEARDELANALSALEDGRMPTADDIGLWAVADLDPDWDDERDEQTAEFARILADIRRLN